MEAIGIEGVAVCATDRTSNAYREHNRQQLSAPRSRLFLLVTHQYAYILPQAQTLNQPRTDQPAQALTYRHPILTAICPARILLSRIDSSADLVPPVATAPQHAENDDYRAWFCYLDRILEFVARQERERMRGKTAVQTEMLDLAQEDGGAAVVGCRARR